MSVSLNPYILANSRLIVAINAKSWFAMPFPHLFCVLCPAELDIQTPLDTKIDKHQAEDVLAGTEIGLFLN